MAFAKDLTRICKDLQGSARICKSLQGFTKICKDLFAFCKDLGRLSIFLDLIRIWGQCLGFLVIVRVFEASGGQTASQGYP